MALQRRRSLPMEMVPLSSQLSQPGPILLSSTPLSHPTSPYGPRNYPGKPKNWFLTQAEALAGMTLELKIRALNKIALRLEQQVERLVRQTADDEEFRHKNEARLTRVMREVHAVKAHMVQFEGLPPVTVADVEMVKQQIGETTEGLRTEIADIRAHYNSVMERLGRPPKAKEVEDNNRTPSAPAASTPSATETRALVRMETRASHRERVRLAVAQRQDPASIAPTPEYRITEAINSTKRWNREHKATKAPDAQFISSYLRKQGRRDPVLATMLQQAIQRRAFRGIKEESGTQWRPQNLEELCHSVTWRDVIEAATEVLVTKRERTVSALRRD